MMRNSIIEGRFPSLNAVISAGMNVMFGDKFGNTEGKIVYNSLQFCACCSDIYNNVFSNCKSLL